MSNTIIKLLEEALGVEKVLTGEKVKERYCHIWRMEVELNVKAVVLPQTTSDVASALTICHKHNHPVVVHGGLTNLVGSTEVNGDEIVIAMEKMNQIEEVDQENRTLTAQAGVILENIQQAAEAHQLLFPLNFGAKGSAQIGGIVSTNAGGLRVFKYGMTRMLVLGLEAVLANGTVISSLKKIIKDNSAYDIKQLFIGSEGTLGVITKVILRLVERPKSRTSAFVAFNEFSKVIAFMKYIDEGLGGTLSSYELIWKESYYSMTSPPAAAKPPLPHGFNYYVLLEGLGADQEKDYARLEDLVSSAFEEGLVEDAALASSDADLSWFWNIRENVHVLVAQANNDQHFDISLPPALIGDYVIKVTEKLNAIPEVEKIFTFGHIADGNIHFVIGKKNASTELIKRINTIIYSPLKDLGGSVSAEHGIGLDKKEYLHLCRTAAEIELMKTLKLSLDPKKILNPGKIFD